MKLYYHHTSRGNVGDDLNAILWPRLIPDLEQLHTAEWLVGAGTIIDQRLDALPGRKIVLGAGYRANAQPSRFGALVEFAAVRGRLSAQRLGLPDDRAVCDPGFVVARWPELRAVPVGNIGFIPHYYSEDWSDISVAAADAGFDVISPTLPVPDFLRRLGACARVFTESLHGAILADAMRVPWARVRICAHHYEGDGVSEFKWRDTFSTLEMPVRPVNHLTVVPVKRSLPRMYHLARPVQSLVERHLAKLLARVRDDDRVFRLSDAARLRELVDCLLDRTASLREARPDSARRSGGRRSLRTPAREEVS